MTISPGTTIQSYEVLGFLGSGGMGEVYHARDLRLGREVAIKLLPSAFMNDSDRLQRFEQEARATAALNDSNVVALYDVGTHEGRPFVVSEYLEGETLRSALLAGPLPLRTSLGYAQQIVRGMAAAHRKGIVHRDLKPENLFVTRDGLIKILDFGLAKLTSRDAPLQAISQESTAPGVVLGTIGYLSPEQARGEHGDQRADIFSFGAILFEMISGRRAFQGASTADTLSAILKEHPPELATIVSGTPPTLDRILQRCLAKSREDRFQSASDLGFALEDISGSSPSLTKLRKSTAARGSRQQTRRRAARAVQPQFRQLTFRRGTVHAARFASDGQTIVFGAAWEGKPEELFSTRTEAPEARTLQMSATGLFALSARDEMALVLEPNGFGRVEGTLARAPLAGGVPRQLARNVVSADWSRDGSKLAIVRTGAGHDVLEYPLGTILYDPKPGFITHIRFSPSGDAIAALVHPVSGDTAGSVVLIDLNGEAKTLSEGWNSVLGLAWRPDGREVWFTGTRSGAAQALHAVSRSGAERLLLRAPATLTLHDVSRDGRVLLTRDAWGAGVIAMPPGDDREHDLSWLDGSTAWDLSADGTTMILEEAWEGGGAQRSIYLRTTDGAPAVRLGDGVPLSLSPDKQWVVSIPVAADQLVLLPTGVGQVRTLPRGNVTAYFPSARWLPDGRHILFSGTEGQRSRIYKQSIDAGDPAPVTAEGVFGRIVVLPDGQHFITRGQDRRLTLYSTENSEAMLVAGAERRDLPIVVSPDGRWLYVQGEPEFPAELARVDLATGQREIVRTVLPPDPAGVNNILRIVMTPDARSYAYTYVRALSALYLVEGI